MKNIILFGGSFDPIHNGHIEMAKRASTFLDAEVIFIPAVISVWKEHSADFIHKVNMINLAIKDYPFLKVSLFVSVSKFLTSSEFIIRLLCVLINLLSNFLYISFNVPGITCLPYLVVIIHLLLSGSFSIYIISLNSIL